MATRRAGAGRSACLRHLDYPEVTVGDLNTSAARLYGDRVALRDDNRAVTFGELHARACKVANELRASHLAYTGGTTECRSRSGCCTATWSPTLPG